MVFIVIQEGKYPLQKLQFKRGSFSLLYLLVGHLQKSRSKSEARFELSTFSLAAGVVNHLGFKQNTA